MNERMKNNNKNSKFQHLDIELNWETAVKIAEINDQNKWIFSM